MPQRSEKTSRLDEIPLDGDERTFRMAVQRIFDQIWNRLNNLESRLDSIEQGE